MTDERMRKFAEAGGWRLETIVGREYWHASECAYADSGYSLSKPCRENCDYDYPDFPNDLSACFEVLERVCEKLNAKYLLSSGQTDGQYCGVDFEHFNLLLELPNAEGESQWPDKCAATKQEAIISAVLSAVEGSK